jgi:hypothetical protein
MNARFLKDPFSQLFFWFLIAKAIFASTTNQIRNENQYQGSTDWYYPPDGREEWGPWGFSTRLKQLSSYAQ